MATAVGSSTRPPIGAAAATGERTAALPTNTKGALGKDQFLQLLVAQMRNQDPMNPQDGQEMAAQLAQFSSVEQLTQINQTLAAQGGAQGSLLDSLTGGLALNAVGKQVEVDPTQVTGPDGAPLPAGTVVSGRVDGVRFTAAGPVLTLGQYAFPFGAIRSLAA